jgi:hypothetical protein
MILNENNTNENTFKTQFIQISCIKYYITQTKIFKLKVEEKDLKKIYSEHLI